VPTPNRLFVRLTVSAVEASKVTQISILHVSAGNTAHREVSALRSKLELVS